MFCRVQSSPKRKAQKKFCRAHLFSGEVAGGDGVYGSKEFFMQHSGWDEM